jgi:hypothetical protein
MRKDPSNLFFLESPEPGLGLEFTKLIPIIIETIPIKIEKISADHAFA